VTAPFSDELAKHGGTAGFAEYRFPELRDDALLFSTENELE
jgi:hypothetical protein